MSATVDVKPKQHRASEVARITCPHCCIGWADVVVQRFTGGHLQFDRAPRRCNKCHRFFQLKTKLQIYGATMEGYLL